MSNTTQFVTFQKNVIIHLYRGDVTECSRNGNYIDSYSMTYKKFFEKNLDEFYFNNPCKDTLHSRLKKVYTAGYTITKNDHITYKYKAVKTADTNLNRLSLIN